MLPMEKATFFLFYLFSISLELNQISTTKTGQVEISVIFFFYSRKNLFQVKKYRTGQYAY